MASAIAEIQASMGAGVIGSIRAAIDHVNKQPTLNVVEEVIREARLRGVKVFPEATNDSLEAIAELFPDLEIEQ